MTDRPYLLLDRDGTLIVEREYLADPAQVELFPGAAAALVDARRAGWGLALLTNQSGLARGRFTAAQLDAVHARLAELLAQQGIALDGIFVCPHGPADDCPCRKPRVGLVTQAVAALDFDPRRAVVVGDKRSDLELAANVGAAGVLVRTGYGRATEATAPACWTAVVDDLPAAVAWALATTRR